MNTQDEGADSQSSPTDRRDTLGKRRTVIAALIAILVLAGALRAVNIGHAVTWDEAWNVNSMIDGAEGSTSDPFFENFYRHPPAYTGLGIAIAWVGNVQRRGLAPTMEVVSILFGLALVLAVFLLGRDWFGDSSGLAAAFLVAVMPASRTFDSWIKQESMVLFFCVIFLLFFFRKQFVPAGIFLGLALLTKETAVLVFAPLVIFVLAVRRKGMLRGLGISAGLGVLLSAWWYVFFSRSRGDFLNFFTGSSQEAFVWRGRWFFYLGRTWQDLGLLAILLGALAIFLLALRFKPLAEQKAGRSPYSRRDVLMFLLLWIVMVYALLSVSYGKPPWMVYAALPAVALLGGWGAIEGARAVIKRGRAYTAAAAVGLAAAVVITFTLLPGGYSVGAGWLTERARIDKDVAEYINGKSGSAARVMMYSFDASPSLMFYLDCYDPETIAAVAGDPQAAQARYLDYSVYLVLEDESVEQMLGDIYYMAPDYVLFFTKPWRPAAQVKNAVEARKVCEQLVKPEIVDGKAALFEGAQVQKAMNAYMVEVMGL